MLGLACARGLDRSAVQELVGFLKEEQGGGGREGAKGLLPSGARGR